MTEFERKIRDLNIDIERATMEKEKLILDKYKEPLNITLMNLYFLKEKMKSLPVDLNSTLSDISNSITSSERVLSNDQLSVHVNEFKKNNAEINRLLEKQNIILNEYIVYLQSLLNKTNCGDTYAG